MRISRRGIPFGVLLLAAPLSAQSAPATPGSLAEQLTYLLGQASGSFKELRGDSIGVGAWRANYRLATNLDSATALSASSITELARQHADGRPGTAIVGVFPLALAAPGDSASFARFRELISAALPSWRSQSPGSGGWTECADPRRGREVLLSTGRTASGQLLLLLNITLHPDVGCS